MPLVLPLGVGTTNVDFIPYLNGIPTDVAANGGAVTTLTLYQDAARTLVEAEYGPATRVVTASAPFFTYQFVVPTNLDGVFWATVLFTTDSTDPAVSVELDRPITLPPPSLPEPTTGLSTLCSPWVTGSDIKGMPGAADLEDTIVESAAMSASEILYALSGRRWAGAGGVTTVRPAAIPQPEGFGAWGMWGGWASGWGFGWGSCCGTGLGYGWRGGQGCYQPPQIDLGYFPTTQILAVKIDGTVIPPGEYRLDNRRTLTRTLTAAGATPTELYGWPVCQDLTLPDTEIGTFSVTLAYGAPPPEGGRQAALFLGQQIALYLNPATCAGSLLSQRATSITRQGETVALIDTLTAIKDGFTGLPLVDLWLRSCNPKGRTRRGQVWTPDIARTRRVPY